MEALIAGFSAPECEVLLRPPATPIARVTEVARGGVLKVGGQDCHAEVSGARTGDISAETLADAGAGHVILGHSERRADHGETGSAVRAKAEAAQAAGSVALTAVVRLRVT